MAEEKKKTEKKAADDKKTFSQRKVNKTWQAIQKYKGSLIVNDPKFLL